MTYRHPMARNECRSDELTKPTSYTNEQWKAWLQSAQKILLEQGSARDFETVRGELHKLAGKSGERK